MPDLAAGCAALNADEQGIREAAAETAQAAEASRAVGVVINGIASAATAEPAAAASTSPITRPLQVAEARIALLPMRWNGLTVGKRLLGLRVVELTGKPMTVARAFKRGTDCGDATPVFVPGLR